MSLKEQIDHATLTLSRAMERVREHRETIAVLKSYRKECKHVFSAPIKGYEHEGAMCTECGINELHAVSHKIGAE